MIRLCVIGWYGTETMGDRAILDGIINVFKNVCGKVILHIASLYPNYTYRTIYEEEKVFSNTCPDIKISVFNVKDKYYTNLAIKDSDIVVFGGGPIMDIEELGLMVSAFELAKSHGVPTMLFGCGLGPLKNCSDDNLKKLFSYSDVVAMRDYASKEEAVRIGLADCAIECIGDPAIISVEQYKMSHNCVEKEKGKLAINLRRFPQSEYIRKISFSNEVATNILNELSRKYERIILTPMHTFFVGGDDRQYFSELFSGHVIDNLSIVYKPQNLWELYNLFISCEACIGMRYHSVLMQTLLNGNNIIFNYTKSAGNKIDNFISYCGLEEQYANRKWDMDDEIDFGIFNQLAKPVIMERKNIELEKSINLVEKILK